MGYQAVLRQYSQITDAELRKVGAQRRLAARREQSAIVAATLGGQTQTAIANLLGVSQPHVSRTIAAVKRDNKGFLRITLPSALDIIDERDAGEIDSDTMMKTLSALDYTDGHVEEINGVPTDAYVRGSWDDIEYAYQQDRLTYEQYEQLFRARTQGNALGANIRLIARTSLLRVPEIHVSFNEDQRETITSLRQILATLLRLDEADIEIDLPVTALGLDSLSGLELRTRVEKALGATLPAAMILDQQLTVVQLADYILTESSRSATSSNRP